MVQPRQLARAVDKLVAVSPGRYDERFQGYAVLGLPFSSGHVLGLRRFSATTVEAAYTSVWHRGPDGRWECHHDAPAEVACPRYFAGAFDATTRTDLQVRWTGPKTLQVHGEDLQWWVRLTTTWATRMYNRVVAVAPDSAWSNDRMLALMGRLAGPLLGAGRVGLCGTAPNGQRFQIQPRRLWMVADSEAKLSGQDLGAPGPLPEQVRLGDCWIPQRGLFMIGRAGFETADQAGSTEADTTGSQPTET